MLLALLKVYGNYAGIVLFSLNYAFNIFIRSGVLQHEKTNID